MTFLNLGSISKKLALLILLAVLPAMGILLYSGLEQRRNSIESAKRDVLMLTHTMAGVQNEITRSTRQVLSTLSLLPAIQAMDLKASAEIFRALLETNPTYNNFLLLDLNGEVIATGRPFAGKNLADRKHIREALDQKIFTVGEYIVSRGGSPDQLLPFAYPVLDKKGGIKAIVTTAINLADFSTFHSLSALPEKSFVAMTDHQGLRLFYYPAQEETNPLGKAIRTTSWEIARKAQEPGIFIGTGSDGMRRIFAFEQVRLAPDKTPYIYVWAGIPEVRILAPANAILTRNLLILLLALTISLFISWLFGKKTFIAPIQGLVSLTQQFGKGDLVARTALPDTHDEFAKLTTAFHDMATALTLSQRTLQENEARFRLLMDRLDALVYVADMDTYEVLFINEYTKKQFGDIIGKTCWQTIQKDQSGPCSFCTNKYLVDADGNPGEVYSSEFQNTVTGQWLFMHDRAIKWIDGRIVRLQIATDITNRKKTEEEREQLIAQLEEAAGKIKTLSGFLPICASCKRIRDDQGYWNQIESYIRDHSEAEFSHSICPGCAKKLYPEFVDDDGNFPDQK
ncbi:MAG: HAMP domain-containing protein [Proteobacteria bacterium]|nr:HAMP domain-containing protein [Pseudomonadota bacterium]